MHRGEVARGQAGVCRGGAGGGTRRHRASVRVRTGRAGGEQVRAGAEAGTRTCRPQPGGCGGSTAVTNRRSGTGASLRTLASERCGLCVRAQAGVQTAAWTALARRGHVRGRCGGAAATPAQAGGRGQVCAGRRAPPLGTQGRCRRALRLPPPTRVRHTALTGAPPFTAAPLAEMFQNIRAGRYPEPAHLSPSARRLIARRLAPHPAERPARTTCCRMTSSHRCGRPGRRGASGGVGAPRPAPRADPPRPLQRASHRSGCRPAAAAARPPSPGPSLCAGSSGGWASCCWPCARLPVSTAPHPAPGCPPLPLSAAPHAPSARGPGSAPRTPRAPLRPLQS